MRASLKAGLLLIILFVLAGCAPLPIPSNFSATTPQPRALSPESLATPTAVATKTPSAPTETFTAEPFAVQFTPVPTETPLPTLELPTEVARPPALQIWDGLPTYPAESKPDFYFRLRFDPDVWALTNDHYGFPALGHRTISGCVISPTAGRGLPPNGTVEHSVRRIGGISYQIGTAFVNGVRQFVDYAAGNGYVYTAFEVSLQDQADACLADAETVLATLTSVPVFEATPIATP